MSENKNAKTPADDGQPVAWMMVNKVIGPPSLHWKPQEDWHITWECKPLYTTPPKREWVGLTLNEAEDFYEKYTDRAELINAIDKFLEEKNRG